MQGGTGTLDSRGPPTWRTQEPEKTMSKDWTADVKKFVPDADAGAIDGIVRYCGIALDGKDSSLVAFSDVEEVGRVRENLLKKKLGLTKPDAELDKAIS